MPCDGWCQEYFRSLGPAGHAPGRCRPYRPLRPRGFCPSCSYVCHRYALSIFHYHTGLIRYFCKRLLGFSGMVNSIISDSSKARTTLLSGPDTLFCPSRAEISALPAGLSAKIRSTAFSSGSGCDSGCDLPGWSRTLGI